MAPPAISLSARGGRQNVPPCNGISGQIRAAPAQQVPQRRTMTARLVGAIAADRKIGAVGQRRQQVQEAAVLGVLHFGFISPDEPAPSGLVFGRAAGLQEFFARSEIRQPDVVEVLRREFALGHPARRAPYRADAKTLALLAWTAQTDDAD